MNTKKTTPIKLNRSGLAVRLIAPTAFAVLLTLSLVGGLGYKISEQIYNYQTEQTLTNNLKLSHGALKEGWQNTSGAALRTEKVLRNYTGSIMGGRLDLLGFPENSGVMVIDSYTGVILQTYPHGETPLDLEITDSLRKTIKEAVSIEPLEKGGFVASRAFSPLGVHLIAFNRMGFEQTQTAPLMRITIMSTLGLTLVLIITLMVGLMRYSVIRPLQTMNKNMHDILREGDFHHEVPHHNGAKEIQELTIQFNTLLSFLEERDNALKAHNEKLEDIVEERTQELKNTQEKLVLGERLAAIGEFASSVAHELRNPLSSIKMGVEKIAGLHGIEGNDRRRLELIQKEVDRLSSMLKGILSFAAPSPLQITSSKLAHIMDDLEPIIKGMAEKDNVLLNIDPIKDVHITADVHKLKQALINCVKNATEAAPQGSEVSVSLDIGSAFAMLHIKNGGEPIPEEAQKRLFEPFFTTKAEGTGLGLPTTKRLLNEMGGDIYVKSDEASGTICTLKLPITPTNKEQ